jgi:transcriptional regulator with XRE-family HTH domain
MAEQFLKAIRKELGITQEDLANAAHIRQIDVSNIERGETKASDGQVAAFVRLISARAASRAFEHVILSAWPEAK